MCVTILPTSSSCRGMGVRGGKKKFSTLGQIKNFIHPRADKFFIHPRVEKFFLPPLTPIPLQDLEVDKIVTYTAYSIVFIDSVVTSSQNVLDT